MKRTRIEQLLDKLCVEMGFCLSPAEQSRIVASPPGSVEAFTDAIFVAEGLDPHLADRHLWRQVRDRVAQHFREFQSDADA